MNLKKLEAFMMVVEKNSFSDAAIALKSSQPAVSQKVKSLEDELGFELFDRTFSGIRLTPAGMLVYQAAGDLIKRWRRLEDELNEFQGVLTGTLTIGASTIPGTYLLPRWVSMFRKQFPKVDVQIVVGDSKKIIDQLLDHHIDTAIIGMELDSGKVSYKPIASDSLVLVAPNGYELGENSDFAALRHYDFVLREEGSGTRKMMEEYLAVNGMEISELKAAVTMGSTESVIAAVEAGLGISFVSKLAALPAANAGRIQLIEQLPPYERTFYLATHIDTANRPIIKEFSALLSNRESEGKKNETY